MCILNKTSYLLQVYALKAVRTGYCKGKHFLCFLYLAFYRFWYFSPAPRGKGKLNTHFVHIMVSYNLWVKLVESNFWCHVYENESFSHGKQWGGILFQIASCFLVTVRKYTLSHVQVGVFIKRISLWSERKDLNKTEDVKKYIHSPFSPSISLVLFFTGRQDIY